MEIQRSLAPGPVTEDKELTALTPSEMVQSQNQLIAWCDNKVASCEAECRELLDAHDRAKKMKWKHKPLYELWRAAVRRKEYYHKVGVALKEGYYIVPNFPIQMFAIRTGKKTVTGSGFGSWQEFRQDAQQLPEGQGEYRNPFPIVHERKEKNGDNERNYQWAEEWDDLEFPITLGKPRIMEATSRAMALKIFDRIGVMPPTRNEDPVIIGQIFNKRGYHEKIVSFMIAWHLDTKMI
jgi:hypothetical protein